jgi:hypothetical protein
MVDTVKAIAGMGVVVVAAAIVIGGWQLGGSFETSPTNRTAVTHEDSSAPHSSAPLSSAAQLQSLISAIGQIDSQLEMNISQTERASITPQKSELVHQACAMSASITSPLPSSEAAFVASNC